MRWVRSRRLAAHRCGPAGEAGEDVSEVSTGLGTPQDAPRQDAAAWPHARTRPCRGVAARRGRRRADRQLRHGPRRDRVPPPHRRHRPADGTGRGRPRGRRRGRGRPGRRPHPPVAAPRRQPAVRHTPRGRPSRDPAGRPVPRRARGGDDRRGRRDGDRGRPGARPRLHAGPGTGRSAVVARPVGTGALARAAGVVRPAQPPRRRARRRPGRGDPRRPDEERQPPGHLRRPRAHRRDRRRGVHGGPRARRLLRRAAGQLGLRPEGPDSW